MTNTLIHWDCLNSLKSFPDKCIDLTVTSPPYDNLRTYNWYSWDFEWIAKELFRVTKDWWVLVWIVWDATIKWSESWTSFKQALFFKEIGFNLHDTMIWEKQTFTATWALKTRYWQVFEYMFILSKWTPKTFNPIKDRETKWPRKKHWTIRQVDWTTRKQSSLWKVYSDKLAQRFNVWKINTECSNKNRFHPAQFSEQIAEDHILSWSNPWDIVLDCFAWSGTTLKMSAKNYRQYVWIEISEEYIEIIKKRLSL